MFQEESPSLEGSSQNAFNKLVAWANAELEEFCHTRREKIVCITFLVGTAVYSIITLLLILLFAGTAYKQLTDEKSVYYEISNPSKIEFFLHKPCINISNANFCDEIRLLEPATRKMTIHKWTATKLSETTSNGIADYPLHVEGFLIDSKPTEGYLSTWERLTMEDASKQLNFPVETTTNPSNILRLLLLFSSFLFESLVYVVFLRILKAFA